MSSPNKPTPQKQSFKEWAAAGGGVPLEYKGREHVWHRKAKEYAEGGDVHMQAGGISRLLKGLKGTQKVLPAAESEENLQKFLGNSRIRERLYHATPKDFKEFKPGGNDPTLSGPAIWLTPDATKQPAAHNIGGGSRGFKEGVNVMPVYAQARSPLMLDDRLSIEWARDVFADGSREFPDLISPKTVEELKKSGYDSIIHADPFGNRGGEQEIIMFEPNKIKSAIGNRGTYDIEDADITKAAGGAINMDKGGAAFGVYPQMKPRRAKQDREAAKNVPVDLARGFVSGVLGAPGDIESLLRIPYDYFRSPTMSELVTEDKTSKTFLPTSEDVEKRLPFKSDTPVSRAATGLGQIGGGFYMGPGSPLRVVGALPGAIRHGATEFAKASAAGAPRVIKPKGGNFLTGSVEKALAPLKTRTIAGETPAQRIPKHEALLSDPSLNKDQIDRVLYQLGETKKEAAIDQWIDRNLGNYVKKEMATPEDPVRRLAEEGVTHLPADAMNRGQWLSDHMEAIRRSEGFPEAGMARTEAGRGWENLADESIQITAPIVANKEMLAANPWLSKLDPNQSVYRAREADVSELGFDHIMDVLRQDVASGRIRPEQLSKVSMEQAVRRTYDYDQEMAKKMREAQIKATEGMPVHKEYPEGYKWIELATPEAKVPEGAIWEEYGGNQRLFGPKGESLSMGATKEEAIRLLNRQEREKVLADALKYEGETMGHCVGGYCPDVISGRSRIYSLRDAKGEPHVTVEVQPDIRPRESYFGDPQNKIVQIKGKQNRAPKEEYLPFVQDFVRGGKWSGVGDFKNTGLYRKSDFIDKFTPEQLDAIGQGEYLTKGEYVDLILKDLKLEGMKAGGPVKLAGGGAIKEALKKLLNPKAAGGEVRMDNGGAAFGIYPKQRATPSSEETKKAVKQASEVGIDLLLPQDAVDVGMMLLPGGKIARKAGASLIAGGTSTDTEAGGLANFVKLLAKEAPAQAKTIREALGQAHTKNLEHSVVGSADKGPTGSIVSGTLDTVRPNQLDILRAVKSNRPIVDFHTHPYSGQAAFDVAPSGGDFNFAATEYFPGKQNRELRTLIAAPANKIDRTPSSYSFFATDNPGKVFDRRVLDNAIFELQRAGGKGALKSIKDDPRFREYFDAGGSLGDLAENIAPLSLLNLREAQGLGRKQLQLSGRKISPENSEATNQNLYDAMNPLAVEFFTRKGFAGGGKINKFETNLKNYKSCGCHD